MGGRCCRIVVLLHEVGRRSGATTPAARDCRGECQRSWSAEHHRVPAGERLSEGHLARTTREMAFTVFRLVSGSWVMSSMTAWASARTFGSGG